MAKCIKCGREVSDEEMKARYDEIWEKYKIVPQMVTICKECREKK
jgi:DNA-directed RNA polymerase subunit RPC12/RpoP